jgi:hypothetical protein
MYSEFSYAIADKMTGMGKKQSHLRPGLGVVELHFIVVV